MWLASSWVTYAMHSFLKNNTCLCYHNKWKWSISCLHSLLSVELIPIWSITELLFFHETKSLVLVKFKDKIGDFCFTLRYLGIFVWWLRTCLIFQFVYQVGYQSIPRCKKVGCLSWKFDFWFFSDHVRLEGLSHFI